MDYRRDSGSDAVHVKTTNDSPPENWFPNSGDNSVWATEDDTESPSKKTRLSSSEIGKSFFKTKLCFKFRSGTCPYAANSCHFAHSSEELRFPPPHNRQETATEEKSAISAEIGRSLRVKHCKKFDSGERCPYGENCTFVHNEASRNRESFALGLGSRGYSAGADGSNVAQTLKPPNWKTRICSKWEITGHCPFGANCTFAHGASELHRFGGGLVEGERKIGTSTTPGTKQAGQVDTSISLVSPGIKFQETSNTNTQIANGVRTQRKWKGPDKISRVYGDWIDDIQ